MGFFEYIGILVFLYYLINVILWIVLDADIELWFKERWGKQRGMNEMYSIVNMNIHRFAFIKKMELSWFIE